jgi:uncharacterized repeat protein (TIGR03943 family)
MWARLHIAPARFARAVALLAWAAFFDWLWLSGEWTRYVGPRTSWVVPFGAIALTVAAVGYLATVRSPTSARLGVRELAALAVLVAPILLVSVVPSPSLGSYAVERKEDTQTARETAPVREVADDAPAPPTPSQPTESTTPAPPATHDPNNPTYAPAHVDPETEDSTFLMDLSGAAEVPDSADAFGVAEGVPVHVVAFVSSAPGPDGAQMEISRFYTSCCAADAVPVSANVAPDDALGMLPELSQDTWVRVTGVVGILADGHYGAVASSVEVVDEPSNPYLPPYQG